MSWLPNIPQGWPWSLWFLVATAALFLLQRFPYTGIFLMIVGAALWSVVLVNLGVIGIGLEAATGRVSRAWLLVPALYFGGYYLLRASELRTFHRLGAEQAQFNAGKTLVFDTDRHDLVIDKGKGDMHPSALDFVRTFGLARAFEGGRVYMLGTKEACELVRGNDVYRSAGVYALGVPGTGRGRGPAPAGASCSIYAPGEPDRPIVRILSEEEVGPKGRLPVRTSTFAIRDETSGRAIRLRSARATLLKAFPMPVMGCALNSAAPAWQCFAGFMRKQSEPVEAGAHGRAVIAAALGLDTNAVRHAAAVGPDAIRGFAEEADARLVEKEVAILEQMLARPLAHQKDSWFWHLPSRPDVVAPYADRIFAALGFLQDADLRASETGRNLWRLAAVLPEEALAPHRAKMIEWLRAGNARPWTEQTDDIYDRLDGNDPAEREIMLHRLETRRGDLQVKLLPSFCRMGSAAPSEVKQRLLALWHKRAEGSARRNGERARDDVPLYFTLARLGLKEQAGKVEQRFYGPTFAAIWAQVTPDFPADLCAGSVNDITNHFRRR